jgi:hypothetical protein
LVEAEMMTMMIVAKKVTTATVGAALEEAAE